MSDKEQVLEWLQRLENRLGSVDEKDRMMIQYLQDQLSPWQKFIPSVRVYAPDGQPGVVCMEFRDEADKRFGYLDRETQHAVRIYPGCCNYRVRKGKTSDCWIFEKYIETK